MSHDFVAVCHLEPTQELIAEAIRDVGGTGAIRTSVGGTVLHIGPGTRVALELPRLIRLRSESVRLMGVPDPTVAESAESASSWWIEVHAQDGDADGQAYAAAVIRSLAAHAEGFTVGVSDDALRPLSAGDHESAPVVLRQAKPTVYLSEWLARDFTDAVKNDRTVSMVTAPDSALTLPVSTRLAAADGSWIVDTGDEYYDGYSGQLLEWDGRAFTSGDTGSAEFMRNENAVDGSLHIQAEVLHPASAQTRIGEFTSAVFRAATGRTPSGWGVLEPVSEPWDVAAVTEFARGRAPKPTSLIVVGTAENGGDAVAVLTVTRSRTGVHESVELLAEAIDPTDDGQCDEFAAAMHTARARTAVAGHHMGLRGVARSPHFSGVTVPAVAIFGPESLGRVGADSACELATDGGRLIGTKPVRSLVVRYADEPVEGRDHPLEAHAKLVAELAGFDD